MFFNLIFIKSNSLFEQIPVHDTKILLEGRTREYFQLNVSNLKMQRSMFKSALTTKKDSSSCQNEHTSEQVIKYWFWYFDVVNLELLNLGLLNRPKK